MGLTLCASFTPLFTHFPNHFYLSECFFISAAIAAYLFPKPFNPWYTLLYLLYTTYPLSSLIKSPPATPRVRPRMCSLYHFLWACSYMMPGEEDELPVTQSWENYCLCASAPSFGFWLKPRSSFSSFFQQFIHLLKRIMLTCLALHLFNKQFM